METVEIGGILLQVHDRIKCEGRNCCIHNPSNHPLAHRPLHWREDIGVMERICVHGIGHDDPDDEEYRNSIGLGGHVHGCDGCCRQGQSWEY